MVRVTPTPYNQTTMDGQADNSGAKDTRRSLFDLTDDSLGELLAGWKQPAYRSRQILEWTYRHGASAYEEMTNLPTSLRTNLAGELPLFTSKILSRQESSDGTVKLLLQWPDHATSECVLLPDGSRRTACISSQVGCPVGCVFCASGIGGMQRQLSAGEIVEQAMRVSGLSRDSERLSNVVFMGLGEPLANYDATLRALRTINAAWGMNIGARKITVSTVGLPGPMRRLADERIQVTLALSLHAPSDELRQRIIPWAQRVSIESLIDACRYYFDRSGREVTLEYILLGGLNDGEPHARQLASVSHQMRSNVNLIAYNPVAGLPYRRPADDTIQRFLAALRERGVNAHLRMSRGLDIDAACGQLRRRKGIKVDP